MDSTRIYPMTVEPKKASEFMLENDWTYPFVHVAMILKHAV